MIELRELNENNYEECFHLHVSVPNDRFVDTVVYSLAEAWVFYKESKVFSIYNDETMIGFVSMYIGENNHQIINFLIDDKYQKKGFGTEAAQICIRYLQNEFDAKRVSVPVNVDHIDAQRFWSKLGFVHSDSVEDGYVFMRYYIT